MSILPKATLNWMKIKKHQIFETATFFTLSIKFITSEPFFFGGGCHIIIVKRFFYFVVKKPLLCTVSP